jgi:integrase
MTANRKKLTEANVLTLPVAKRPYRVWDSGTGAARGLHILVQPTGTRTYRVTYQVGGGKRAIALGRVGVTTLEEARTKARQAQRTADDGHDPKRFDPKLSDRFTDLLDTWTQQEQIGRKRAVSADESKTFVRNSCAAWLNRPIATIRRAEVEAVLWAKRETAPYSANRLFRSLACFFRWCINTERLSKSPMQGMPLPWDGEEERNRPWFKGDKADDLLRALWACADKIGGHKGRFIKLAIVTGKRRTIIQTMQWEAIDADWFWTPPPGSSTKRNHPMPLPKLAQRILTPRLEKGSAVGWFNQVELLTHVRKSIGVEDFIWHGLRHIMATKLKSLRVRRHVRKMIGDKVPFERDAQDGYEHDDDADRADMLEALELWAAYIERLVQPAEGIAVLR